MTKDKIEVGDIVRWIKKRWFYSSVTPNKRGLGVIKNLDDFPTNKYEIKKVGITTEKHDQEINKYRSAIDGLLTHLGYNSSISDVEEACEVMGYNPIKLAKEFSLAEKEKRAIDFTRLKTEANP